MVVLPNSYVLIANTGSLSLTSCTLTVSVTEVQVNGSEKVTIFGNINSFVRVLGDYNITHLNCMLVPFNLSGSKL